MDTLYETLRPSTKNDFEIIKKIGEGSFGKVYKVRRKQDRTIYALKVINITKMDKTEITNTLNEIRILCSLNNPYVVAYKEAFLTRNEKEMAVVMEFVSGGDLSHLIDKKRSERKYVKEDKIWNFLCQILIGLDILHETKVMHRDIKPANLFITKDLEVIKLGDLNVAKIAKNDLAKTQIGTPYYLAPEIWKNKTYDYRCDIFSLGCVIYELISLRMPFEGKNMQQIFNSICNKKPASLPYSYSKSLKNLVYKMLTKNPKSRPNVKQILEFQEIKFQMLKHGYKNDFQIKTMMKTIKIPKNLGLLKKHLPKKKYQRPSSVKKRENFVIKSKNSGSGVYKNKNSTIDELIRKIEENKLKKKLYQQKENKKIPPMKSKKKLPPINNKYGNNNNKYGKNNNRNRKRSPQVNRYREYLAQLNNKVRNQRENSRKKQKRINSAEPKKRKRESYDAYIQKKYKAGWWG